MSETRQYHFFVIFASHLCRVLLSIETGRRESKLMFPCVRWFTFADYRRLHCQHYQMRVDGHSSSGHTHSGRLSATNNLGADLLMCLPSTISHQIDVHSPMHPSFQGGHAATSAPSPKSARKTRRKASQESSEAKATNKGLANQDDVPGARDPKIITNPANSTENLLRLADRVRIKA